MISPDLLSFLELLAESTDQEPDDILDELWEGLSLPERNQLVGEYDNLIGYIVALRTVSEVTANFAVKVAGDMPWIKGAA